ncbi:MAG: DUF4175 family protein, partial [Phycisphaerae bacterium]
MTRNSTDKKAAALPNGRTPIPESIVHSLTGLIRRLRTVILVRGISATLATAVGALLMVMAIDAGIMLFSLATRWLLTLVALGATAFVAVYFLILPLAKTFTLAGIARAIETRHPELQERLSSAVELLLSRDMPQIRGSEVLIAELVKQASRDAGRVQPTREITLRTARPFLIAAGATVLVLAVLMALAPSQALRLLARAVAPYLNLPNVSADQLAVRPGDIRLIQGDSLDIEVVVANDAVGAAELRKVGPDGSEKTRAMTRVPAPGVERPRFVLTNSSVNESFRYRIRAGDALTRYYSVTVVQPPAIARIEARYEYPAYIGRPPAEGEAPAGKLSAPAGTAVRVVAVFDKPLVSAEVLVNGEPVAEARGLVETRPDGSPACAFRLDLRPEMQGAWALRVVDRYGFTSKTPDYPLEVLSDQPPSAHILVPKEDRLRLKPDDRLPIQYALEDDFGISRAELQVESDGRKLEAILISLPPADAEAARAILGDKVLDLGTLPLRGAQRLTFRLRTLDNLPDDLHGPQEGLSDLFTVELDTSAASYVQQLLSAEEKQIRDTLKKILEELLAAKKDSGSLKGDLLKVQALDDGLVQRIDRIRNHLGTAEATARDLAN